MNNLFPPVEDLVPHRAPMLLIGDVISASATELSARVDPKASLQFADADGNIPAYLGIEYMAQAIAAFAGLEAHQHNRPVQLGFLLGTRRYKARVTAFTPEQPLHVNIREILRDENNLVLFDCQLFSGEQALASAQIKAIQPDNVAELFSQMT